jgi:hypothetical protein
MNSSNRAAKSLFEVYEMYTKGDQIIICLAGSGAPITIFSLPDVRDLLKF